MNYYKQGNSANADKKELKKIQHHYDIANFHAGIPVLVRDSIYTKWLYTLFGMYNETNVVFPFVVVDMVRSSIGLDEKVAIIMQMFEDGTNGSIAMAVANKIKQVLLKKLASGWKRIFLNS